MADGDLITIGKAKFQEVSMVPLCILLRSEHVNKNDIRYSRKLPSYLYLECIEDGTTNIAAPDFSNAVEGSTVTDGTAIFEVKDKRRSDFAKIAEKIQRPQTIDGISFDGSKSISRYCVCTSSADAVQKLVACENFSLETGARVTVKFMSNNEAECPELNVNNTGAKEIWYRGKPIPGNHLMSDSVYEFVYNGSQYELVGSPSSNDATVEIIVSSEEPSNDVAIWIET